jgi:predicted phosphodiesterase
VTRRRLILAAATYVAAWLVLSAVAALVLFLSSQRTIDVASHEAVLRPDLSGEVLLRTGPVFPDLRTDSGSVVGVQITLGKTDATSVNALGQRYAAIATNPDGQIAAVRRAVTEMAVSAGIRGAALGALPVLLWIVVGDRRRRELWRRVPTRTGVVGVGVVVLVGVGLTQPWADDTPPGVGRRESWLPLTALLGPSVPVPAELDGVDASGGTIAEQTQRLIDSMVSTYEKSRVFYDAAAEDAAELELREPAEDETVVLVVSDRHDNVGMDAVARAIGDRAGATSVFDAGDDTSTGESWEAFSLDSLAAAFEDYDGRWAVAGNHDHGDFVRDYLAKLDWTYFDGEVLEGPGESRLLGVDDPRSSGLGNWRDESGLSFDDVRQRLADEACAADEDGDRVGTLLVHDANLGSAALERGCVDLVVGGHTHVLDGPRRVVGENDAVGYTFTVGTTGGAAYAIATGSKPRRPAGVALLTYRDGRPVGVQGVTLQTNGRFDVAPYTPLDLDSADSPDDARGGSTPPTKGQ